MIERVLTLPQIMLIAATRTTTGAGMGLLLARRLTKEQCKAAGWALLVAGAMISIPVGIELIAKRRAASTEGVSVKPAA